MSLLFSDGFDGYGTNITAMINRWGDFAADGGGYCDTSLLAPGRGSAGRYLHMRFTNQGGNYYYLGHPLGAQTALVFGMAIRWFRLPNTIDLFDVDWTQTAYRYEFAGFGWPDGSVGYTHKRLNLGFTVGEGGYLVLIYASHFGTELAKSPMPVFKDGLWVYFEAKFSTAGDLVVKVDGEVVWNATGLNLNPYGQGYPWLYLGHTGGHGWFFSLFGGLGTYTSWQYEYDDFYIASTGTGDVSDFLGDVSVTPLYPVAAGPRTDFAPFPATMANWDAVNEVQSDGDATNVESDTLNATDLYQFQQVTNSAGAIVAVQYTYNARRYRSHYTTLAPVYRRGSFEATAGGVEVPGDYAPISVALERNPLTNAGWTPADFNDPNVWSGMRITS